MSTTQADDAGRSEDAAAIEAGRLLFARPCRFVAGVADAESLPPLGPNEAAFAGRSNVGKSSLVNALTDQKALARASHTPGRTRQLNFFDLDGRLALVDLPGYGHAAASKSAIKQWTGLVIDYLKGRANLRRVLLLIDGRHGIKPIDQSIMTLMDEAAVSYQIVLTKIDEVKAPQLNAVMAGAAEVTARHGAAHPEILATSAVSGAGIAILRARLVALASAKPIG